MKDPFVGPDRRKFKRLQVSFIVFYKVDSPLHVRMLIGEREVNAIMLDLSESGMGILTNYKMPESTLLSIKFILVKLKFLIDQFPLRVGKVCTAM